MDKLILLLFVIKVMILNKVMNFKLLVLVFEICYRIIVWLKFCSEKKYKIYLKLEKLKIVYELNFFCI